MFVCRLCAWADGRQAIAPPPHTLGRPAPALPNPHLPSDLACHRYDSRDPKTGKPSVEIEITMSRK